MVRQTRGTIKYCPPDLLQEIESIRVEQHLGSFTEAARQAARYARKGRERAKEELWRF